MKTDVKQQEVLTMDVQAAKPPALSKGTEAGALMTIIERISTMPDLDLDRVERLFAMHQQMLAKQAETEFNEAMARTQNTYTRNGKTFVRKNPTRASAKPATDNAALASARGEEVSNG